MVSIVDFTTTRSIVKIRYIVMTNEFLGCMIEITMLFDCGSSSIYPRFAAITAVDKAEQIATLLAVLGLNIDLSRQRHDSACNYKY